MNMAIMLMNISHSGGFVIADFISFKLVRFNLLTKK